MLIRLAFLAPDIQAAVFAGQQPQNLSLEGLRHRPIPLAWEDQRAAFCD
jgi:site-specific DNA recombinase